MPPYSQLSTTITAGVTPGHADAHVKLNAMYNAMGNMVYYGTGFPQGVVSAPVGAIYIDKAITNGASSWIKKSGTGNTGWQVLEGEVSTTIPASGLLNGWGYENTAAAMILARTGSIVTLSIPAIGLRGTSATANTFYALPAGYRISTAGNYGTVGLVNAGTSASPSLGVIAKDFNNIACSARTSISGIISWRTNEAWPAA